MTPATDEDLAAELREIIDEFDCVAGTLHRWDGESLELVADHRIPDPVLERVERVPVGKGMAGLAAKRREPVQVCNLQTDDSGVAEGGARETGMEGSVAAPVFDSSGEFRGVIGVAKPEEYEFSTEELDRLSSAGEGIADRL